MSADDKPSCSSPRPMAFTVDFGDSTGDEDKKKKLALRDSIGRFAPAKIKNKLIKDNANCSSKEVILDEENNIAHKKEDDAVAADAQSDTGTYTIEDDEKSANEKSDRNKDIEQAFGVPEPEKICSREWVSMWAASNSFAEDNPIQEEEDLELEGRSSSQRRRLPPTPLRQNGYHSQDNHELVEEDTNDYLRDTISLMTAMEARLSSAEEASTVVNRKEASTPKRRPKTASSDLRSSKNSAAAKAKEAKEQAAQQWQRRKNYDPLKSMANARKANRDAHNYNTDESSDVESLTSVTRGVSNPRVAMIRSDGGRHSLRQGRSDVPERGGGSPQPQSLHSPLRRPPFKNVMSQNGGRSTSSLSSKEAEFQAWKRRKNYNPMRSATASIVQTKSTSSNKMSHQPSQPTKTQVSKTASNSSSNKNVKPEKSASNSQLHKRSASFHYPDGTSRVTHSVYSSEEDFNDDDDDDEEPRLYEVNDDELFLAYDSGGVVPPRRFKRSPPRGTGSTSSGTASGSKLEALDNLVISTIFSVSTKLCVLSGKLVKSVQERTEDKEEEAMLQTLLYVLDDIDPPVSPSKKTSRELAGTLRNLKKVEQALQTLERSETDL